MLVLTSSKNKFTSSTNCLVFFKICVLILHVLPVLLSLKGAALRGGFRGGDLVTCHPLFSDMTLQSQILVIESLFLTSVSKFIRKYLLSRQFSYIYSSCTNPAISLVKFSDNFFSVHCREIKLDLFEKVGVA